VTFDNKAAWQISNNARGGNYTAAALEALQVLDFIGAEGLN
jgi:hypothetical protein